MDVVKWPLMVTGGVLVAAAPGSLWWAVPMLAYGAAAVYEHTTEPEERPLWLQPGQGRRLLAAPGAVARWVQTGERPALAAPAELRAAPDAGRGSPALTRPVGPRPRWLQVVNDEPDQRPHMLILGPTRSGKTTLATAAMGDREGHAVVITPKLNPSNWRGAEIVTLDDDGTYAPISAALDAIEREKRDRIRVLRTHGADALEPLTIVFDEIGELAAFEPRAPEMMTQLSSIGAELKLRIIGIGTSDEALGVKRWKATRNNYVRIETDADRRAVLDDGVRKFEVATRDVVPRAQAAQLRPWRGEVPARASTGTTEHLRLSEAELVELRQMQATPRTVAAEARRNDVVSVAVPARPVARPAADPAALLGELMAELPPAVREQVPDISPERAARLAQILATKPQAGGAPPAQFTATLERGEGEGLTVNLGVGVINVPPAPAAAPLAEAVQPAKITKPDRRERREGAVNVANRRRKLERKTYYEQAARDGVSLQSAYDARPAGEKGDYNEASHWYREAKRRMKAS